MLFLGGTVYYFEYLTMYTGIFEYKLNSDGMFYFDDADHYNDQTTYVR